MSLLDKMIELVTEENVTEDIKKKDNKVSVSQFLERVRGGSFEELNYLRHVCLYEGRNSTVKVVITEMINRLQGQLEELE